LLLQQVVIAFRKSYGTYNKN